jgi:hypothetical protein
VDKEDSDEASDGAASHEEVRGGDEQSESAVPTPTESAANNRQLESKFPVGAEDCLGRLVL